MKKDKLLDKAQKLLQKGYFDKAVVEFAAALAEDPSDVSVRLKLGDIYAKLNKKAEAIKEYTEVAKVHTAKGFYLKAIAVFKQILKLEDTSLEIHNKLAELYTKQRLIADAITEYSYIVGAYEKKGRTAEAFELLKKMAGIAPDNMGVRLKLADTHLKQGFDKEAMAEYKIVVGKLLEEGKDDRAERIYVDIYKSKRKEPMVLDGLISIFRKKGDQEKVLRFSQELFEVAREKGDTETATRAAQDILKINPGHRDAKAYTSKPDMLGGAPGGPRPGVPGELPPLLDLPDFGLGDMGAPKPAAAPPPVVSRPAAPPPPKMAAPAPAVEEKPLLDINMDALAAPAPAPEPEEEMVEMEVEEPTAIEMETEEELEVVSEDEMEVAEVEEAEAIEVEEEGSAIEVEMEEEAPVASAEESLDDGLVDLQKELGIDDMLSDMDVPWDSGSGGASEEYKAGMGEQLGKEDTETHYNLGIAYMEMELYNDAIREFKIAAKDKTKALDSFSRLGMCLVASGSIDEAVGYYNKALEVEGLHEEDKKGIMFELGLAYAAGDRKNEAVEMLRSVEAMDPNYRNVSEKIRELIEGKSNIPNEEDDLVEVEIV
ncbi:MAG: tetratricopeptide repeat protein [Deltaproteobacteria bacterium]|nr:tetratricopeptide repeat protein [Deltaproteobacteria bacterium]